MKTLPVNPTENATPESLHAFLTQCRAVAMSAGRPQLISISLAVDALDPLAVLESIFEPEELHFYAERPDLDSAIAGAETALIFESAGATRFADVQKWIDDTLENTIAIGAVDAPFGGPHFFTAFAFLDQAEPADPFPAARVFVPRWQVSRAGNVTTAVANFVVAPDADLLALSERVWRAHQKFNSFGYQEVVEPSEQKPARLAVREAGDYRAAVARGLAQIESGKFTKIVLARAKEISADQALHPLQMLNGLRQRFPDCYAFSLANGKGQSFIGASPERLVRVSKGVLETEALAGSIRRGSSASEDSALAATLLRSEKDLREHQFVLEAITTRLTMLGLKPEFAAHPGLRRLANVQHLHTPIRAALGDSVRLLQALAWLHPTPAVGGAPQSDAVPHIRGLEGFSRGLYAGAIGWVNSRGGGEFFVGLRSALVDGATARLYAGAGIVAGSTPEKEFAETELKFKAMLDALTTA
ncbi:isochorismate synthase [Oleiharenicola lentus]|uniref:isochorismate synthase n=1 Tax=Oleiharenicola lentus TaxID=2508720 RepID=UPI003F671FCD